jgi:acetyltransferase
VERFFYPQSIAVAGVSPEENKTANAIVSNLIGMGYGKEIYCIGKTRGSLFGLPVYGTLKEIDKKVDLIVIMVPAHQVPFVLRQAGEAGINRAVIITAGFNELGGEGDRLAKEIKEISDRYSIRFIGPNCQGIVCPESGVCVPFAPLTRDQVRHGGVSLIAQSGSVGWIGSVSFSYEIDGVSKVISIGNKINITEVELTEYLINDPETRIIALYLESFSDARMLCELARSSPKPVIVFKSNISSKGSSLAFSHTAALASNDRIVEGAFDQAGILRAWGFREMIETCKAMSLAQIKGPNLVVMAASGGMGVIGEDAVQGEGLSLTTLSPELLNDIAGKGDWKIFNITNPIDTGGFFNNQEIIKIVDKLLTLDEVDGVVLSAFTDGPYCHPFDTSGFVDEIKALSEKRAKPVALSFVTDPIRVAHVKKQKDFPIFDNIEDAVRALSIQLRYGAIRKRKRSPNRDFNAGKKDAIAIINAPGDSRDHLNDVVTMQVVSAYGIKCQMPVFASDLESALSSAKNIGYPVVIKISSPDISHKTDVGGVKTGILNEKGLMDAFDQLLADARELGPEVRISGVVIQKMVPAGMEVIIGGRYDRDFGPVIMFGTGGIFVDAFDDVVFRMAPICLEEAYEMLEKSRCYSILKGLRNEKAFDIPVLADALERVSMLLGDFPEISELDLNPVKIFSEGEGLVVIDGRMIINRSRI